MRARFAFCSLAALALADAAAAQPVVSIAPGGASNIVNEGAGPQAAPEPPLTDIRADRNNPLALGTIVTHAGRTYLIDGGTRAGDNLFHSFSRFDLGQGDFARWVHSGGDAGSIRTVVNRVTGGDPSHIFGTLDSTGLPNADFYFINPAGIVFGAGAKINVPAAAHFSSAQELRFADGPAFTVSTPGGSAFSIASPAAFGFVGGQGDVQMTGLDNVPFTGSRLTVTGRDVAVANTVMGADGFGVVAVGSGAAQLSVDSPRATSGDGRASVSGSTLRSRASDGILVSGGVVSIDNSALGTAIEPGPRSGVGGPISISGRDVTILDSQISASTSGAEDAGEIRIAGENVRIGGASMIQSETNRSSTGAAGGIAIVAGNLTIEDGTRISSSTQSARRAGDILLSGERVVVGRSSVASDSRRDTVGDAGRITVKGGELHMRDGASLSSTSDGSGNAGFVDVAMRDGIYLARSSIGSEARGTAGESGVVRLAAPAIVLDDRSLITTSTATSGNAGEIRIAADDLQVLDRSVISSETRRGATGNGGLIFIGRMGDEGGSLLVADEGAVRSDTNGSGDAGGIFIAMDHIEVRDGGRISSDAGRSCAEDGCGPLDGGEGEREAPPAGGTCPEAGCASIGNAGNITISAVNLRLIETDEMFIRRAGISSDSINGGDGGTIAITLTGDLVTQGSAGISSDTSNAGKGGDIRISARNVRLSGTRGGLSTTTFGTAAAGSTEVFASETIRIENEAIIASQSGDARSLGGQPGSGAAGDILLAAPQVIVTSGGAVSATTFTDGEGGTVTVRADSLEMLGLSSITSASQGPGPGGSIDVRVDSLVMRGAARIDTDSTFTCTDPSCAPGGPAGSITIHANRIQMAGVPTDDPKFPDSARISSDTDTVGNAGNIFINVTGTLAMDLAEITSLTTGAGDAGLVDLSAGHLVMNRMARIATNARPMEDGAATGDAGRIAIAAQNGIFLGAGTEISSNTAANGRAGEIAITTPQTLLLAGGRISSGSAPGSTGPSGTVRISAGRVEIDRVGSIETISRNAEPAGAIAIVADELLLTGSQARISSSNAEPGTGDAGSISITADDVTIAQGASITSSSVAGAAGDVLFLMPSNGLLRLESSGMPSLISTSSGPGTGGRIRIASPRAIISNGGSILALGQQGGANVVLSPQYLISSSDRLNEIAVNGNFLLDAAAYDVSAGTVNRDLSVLDASGVLRGQCAAVRQTGQVSQLVVRPIGPYGARPTTAAPDRAPLLTSIELQASCS